MRAPAPQATGGAASSDGAASQQLKQTLKTANYLVRCGVWKSGRETTARPMFSETF